MKRFFLFNPFIYLFFILPLLAYGQTERHSLIVQFESESARMQWVEKKQPQKAGVHWEAIGNKFPIYELSFPKAEFQTWEKSLYSDEAIRYVEHPAEAELRSVVPNDELYSEQWAMPLLGLPDTWSELNGAQTARQDEIVVAVLDNGFLTNHPDLENQVWQNTGEIPMNGIDDDGNGFIDDINGWNFRANSPMHEAGSHGSPVAGILGASTDNQEGIAGVAYNSKLMPLTPSLKTTEIYGALEYAYEQRRLYNESNGQQGSFVVAANISLGIDFTFPRDFPIWCELLDSLAQVGIIPVVSTTNALVDIEEEGDMPGLCGIDAQITVTKTTRQDEKDPNEGGFNSTFVHLGAPGENIQATSADGTYGVFSGTSASAPFVSGAIALLYSAPCEELADSALIAPRATALKVKQLILQSVEKISSLADNTVSGGRLDIFNAMRGAPALLCGRDSSSLIETGPQVQIDQVYPNPTAQSVQIIFTPISLDPVNIQLFDMVGRLVWEEQAVIRIFEQQDVSIDIPNNFSQGAYILKVAQRGSEDTTIIIYTP